LVECLGFLWEARPAAIALVLHSLRNEN